MFTGALTQRRLARLLAVAAGIFMLVVFVAPKGLLESPWSPESSDEKLKHEADRQMDVLTVADTNTGKRRFVMDRLRATFTRNTWGSDRQRKAAGLQEASADGAGGGGGDVGAVGGAGAGARRAEEVKQPEEVSGEKVESRQKPLPVNLPAVKKKKRRTGPFSRRSVLEKSSVEALEAGQMALREMRAEMERLETLEREGKKDPRAEGTAAVKTCQRAIVLTEGDEELKSGDIKLPCGMRVGSAITVVGMVPSAPAEAGRGGAAPRHGGAEVAGREAGAGEVAAGGRGTGSEGSALSFMLEILVSGGEWCLGGGAGECEGVPPSPPSPPSSWLSPSISPLSPLSSSSSHPLPLFVPSNPQGSGVAPPLFPSPALAPEGAEARAAAASRLHPSACSFFLVSPLPSPLLHPPSPPLLHPALLIPPFNPLIQPPTPFPQGLVVVTPAAAFFPNPFPNSLIQPPTPFPQGLVVVKGEEATRIYHLHAHLTGDSRGSSGISSVVAGSGGSSSSSSSSSSVGGSAGVRVIEQNTCYRGQWGESEERGGSRGARRVQGGGGGGSAGVRVIEQNTCYHGQWGESVRCEGFASTYHEGREVRGVGKEACQRGREVGAEGGRCKLGVSWVVTSVQLDGQRRCEKWSRERARTEEDQERMDGAEGADGTHLDTEKLSGWQRQVMKQADKEVTEEWPFPFHEDRLFVLVVRAGWEGFHVSVDGNHVASFQYRSGNPLEEATAVAISGAIRLKSFVATSLPLAPPLRTADLEASESLKAPAVRGDVNVSMFIGILSATNHFAERTAVRKTWLQHPQIRSGEVVARFFLALHPSIQVNVEVHKEAALYGDMVVLPFIDRYDLVVLKTIAICEFGLRNVTTNYIMKVDDDNFVRLDAVFDEIRFANHASGLYMGNINEFHKPLREGKWAVSEEEWPETNYPPYANGPGYIITRDIADFIVRMKEYKMLRIFKMEDVSMGMWVVQYGINNTIHYIHNWRFCQFGCMDDYLTAHYQSPRQMLCMWTKLSRGEARCCT
ncbi:unnamed protein product [Closterium sp. Naga37s-1]|nr:unnamed protein product [Closterium sp. Naga37s-1]